jgi:hypothetical protein
MVPIRAVFEHKFVQAEVSWDEEESTVTAKDRTGRTVILRIGDNNYRVRYRGEDEYKYTDVAPIIENGRTLLPLRAISESLNFQVDWMEKEKKVDIKEKYGYNRKLLSPESWQTYLKKGGK